MSQSVLKKLTEVSSITYKNGMKKIAKNEKKTAKKETNEMKKLVKNENVKKKEWNE